MPETLQAMTRAEAPPLRIDFIGDVAPLEEERPGLFGLFSATGDNPLLLLRYYYLRGIFSDAPEWNRKQHPRRLDDTSEALYPGWTATVNGLPTRILPTNVAFRGLPLEAGENHIVMRYVPQHLISSSVITLLALAMTISLLIWGRRREFPNSGDVDRIPALRSSVNVTGIVRS